MLQEVFKVYVIKPLRKKAPQFLRWMRSVLQQYKRPFLTDDEISDMQIGRLWHLVQVWKPLIACVLSLRLDYMSWRCNRVVAFHVDEQNGTAIFCLLYQFFGGLKVGQGANAVRVDSLRVRARPKVGGPLS